MVVISDLLAAVRQIAAERNIEPDDVLEAVEEAIRTGYRKDYGLGESLIVEIDSEKNTFSVYADKKVVKKVTSTATQISLEDAKKIEPKLEVGDHVQVDITPEGEFGRIAVQAAKQVIMQKVREAEKEAVMKEFKDKIGTVEAGIIQRMDGDSVLIEIRKAIAVMPHEERLPGEYYRSGDRMKFYMKEIDRSARGKQLIVSRSAPEFLAELFALEVPEIRSGSVEIKAIAREAGSRSKVAVVSNQEGVDPIGACVGQKGIRIDNITEELKGEKIDIIIWDEDTATFIANSLSPAQVKSISLEDKEKEASIIVPDDQLSLAIGNKGQNARLASKLTGWKIDIDGETIKTDKEEKKEGDEKKVGRGKKSEKKSKTTKKTKAKKEKSELEALGIAKRTVTALQKAGIVTVDALKQKIESGEKIAGVGAKSVEEIKGLLK